MFAQTGPAQAERDVVVNGLRLSSAQIGELEGLNCGPIPDGYYWLARRSGIWGYEGNPTPRGRIAGNCSDTRRLRLLPDIRTRAMKLLREKAGVQKEQSEIRREESEIGTTSQPHGPTDPKMPQANGR